MEVGDRIGEMFPLPARGSVYEVKPSPDGHLLAVLAGGKNGSEIYILEWPTGRFVRQLDAPPARYFSLAFSPDGKTLAAGTGSGHIEFWDTETWVRSEDLLAHPSGDWVMVVAFSPDGAMLASGAWDGSFHLTRIGSEQEAMEPAVVHTRAVQGLAFHPEWPFVASGSDDGRVIIWDAQTSQTVSQLSHPTLGDVNSVAFSPDGSRLAAGGEGILVIWDFDPASWAQLICQIVARSMTEGEWGRFIGPDNPYDPVCPAP
jgi:WD40 repeat protein